MGELITCYACREEKRVMYNIAAHGFVVGEKPEVSLAEMGPLCARHQAWLEAELQAFVRRYSERPEPAECER